MESPLRSQITVAEWVVITVLSGVIALGTWIYFHTNLSLMGGWNGDTVGQWTLAMWTRAHDQSQANLYSSLRP